MSEGMWWLLVWLVPVIPIAVVWKRACPDDDTNDMVAGAIIWPILLVLGVLGVSVVAFLFAPIWGLGKLVDWLVEDRTPQVQCEGCGVLRTKREWKQIDGVCCRCETNVFEGKR